MASVDVVVPCYNYARYLRRCIETILSQEGVSVRVLIIDDASTDDTPTIAESIARSDPRVEYRRHARNMRHIATYNEGLIEWASADYSLLLSADDLLAPGALKRATDLMEMHADVHMTYGLALLFFEDSDIADSPTAATVTHGSGQLRTVDGPTFIRRSVVGNPVPTPAAVVRTRVQKEVGGYSASLPHTADMEMWMRFAAHGSIGVVPFVQAYKRMHKSNMSIQYYDRPLGDFRERAEACRELIARFGSKMGRDAPTLREMYQTISEQVFWAASGLADQGRSDACNEALRLAEELWPEARTSAAWRRLQLKRALPAGLRSVVVPLLQRVRGKAGTPPVIQTTWFPRQQIGWWPG